MRTDPESLIGKFVRFINKDTCGENESKKTVLVIRILLLTFIVYFIFNVFLCNFLFARVESMVVYFTFITVTVAIFALSYHCKTTAILWGFIASILIWVLSVVHFIGWDTGVQHFLMILLILYFFSGYKNYMRKVLFTVGLIVMRIWMFYVYNARIPILELPATSIATLQILNTVTIFWCISVVSFVFSESSRELEGKLIEYNRRLEMEANADALTGLFNRRYAMERLEELLGDKSSGWNFSVCIADIDFFKKINDEYGHDFGDEVLKELARLFKEVIQGQNMVARWGGEEFLFLFAEKNGEYALQKMEELRQKVKELRICKDEKEVGVTMTFGIAEFDPFGGLNATLKEADEKLYMGKKRGRDCVIF